MWKAAANFQPHLHLCERPRLTSIVHPALIACGNQIQTSASIFFSEEMCSVRGCAGAVQFAPENPRVAHSTPGAAGEQLVCKGGSAFSSRMLRDGKDTKEWSPSSRLPPDTV